MDNRDQTQGAMSRPSQGGLSRSGQFSRYNPFYEMQEQMRRMDALFNRFFGFEPFPSTFRSEFQQFQQMEPDADIYEADNEYIIHAALPGIDPQDIRLEATEDTITLSAERRLPFQGGNAQSGVQVGQPTYQGAAPQSGSSQGSSSQAGTSSGQAGAQGSTTQQAGQSSTPHTQHRQSRFASQSQIRMAYTLPTPINPNEVRANFRNGVLELHLPKQQPTANKPISIPIQGAGAAASTSIGAAGQQPSGSAPGATPSGGMHEGSPASKMGSSYTPSASENHVTQAQAAGDGTTPTDHQPGRETGPTASGQTKPEQPAPASAPAGSATTETRRS